MQLTWERELTESIKCYNISCILGGLTKEIQAVSYKYIKVKN